jgi:hypothetical protein
LAKLSYSSTQKLNIPVPELHQLQALASLFHHKQTRYSFLVYNRRSYVLTTSRQEAK